MFVVTLPASAAQDPTSFARKAKEAGAEILEIRGDLTPDLKAFKSDLPILFAPRGFGHELIDVLNPAYVDLEMNEHAPFTIHDSQSIISYHNYECTPSIKELQEMIKEMQDDNPDIIKIATTINSYADLRTLDELQNEIPSDQKRVILGMGMKAHLNRMLSPMRNVLTYTYMDDGEQAADGQVPLSMYAVTNNKPSQFFGILGSLDVQSKSPLIHNTLFNHEGIDALYSLCLTDNLDDAWEHLTALGVQGFSVTSPWKQKIIEKLDRLDPAAEELGTVNTVVKEGDEWVGYPRDAEGLVRGYNCLQNAEDVNILGSGGVVPSVIAACKQAGVQTIRLFARNEQKRRALAEQFELESYPLEDVKLHPAKVLICSISTDVSMPLPIPTLDAHAIDLRYGKETQFLVDAEQAGYEIHDGLPMLLHQALAQFELFTGITAKKEHTDLLTSLLIPTS